MPLPDPASLRGLLRRCARAELLPRFLGSSHRHKADGSLVTEADLAMQAAVSAELTAAWPDIALLGEEMAPQEQQALLDDPSRRLWCLDPLDGTGNFSAGLPLFSVSLALLEAGRPVLGLVYDPVRDECFWAGEGTGAYLDDTPLTAAPNEPPPEPRSTIAIIDLKRLERAQWQRLLTERPFASQRNLGSCALEWAWIAAGRGHVYLHGGMKLWDLAAGSLILAEAGGHSATFDREPVFRPALGPRSVCAARHGALVSRWLDWLGGTD